MTDPRPVCTEKTQDIIKTLRSNVQVEAALELAVKQQEKRIADQIILTETPAPPFHEEERAKVLLGMFKQYGLTDVKQDAIGNVIGRRKGTGNVPHSSSALTSTPCSRPVLTAKFTETATSTALPASPMTLPAWPPCCRLSAA